MSIVRSLLILTLSLAAAGGCIVTGESPPELAHTPESPIVQLDDTSYVLRGELWDALPELAEHEAMRLVPTIAGGERYGAKLFAIRPGSLVDQLGLRNGDVVRRIAELPIMAEEDVFAAYYLAHGAPAIDVVVVRDGREHTLHYQIDRPR